MKKDDEVWKTGELLFKIFIIAVVTILSLTLFYASIKYTFNYFTMSDEQICKESDSRLINGSCHIEIDKPVNEKRNHMLFGIIGFPIISILFIFYLITLIKSKFK